MFLSLSHQTLWTFSTNTFLRVAEQYFEGAELVDEPQDHVWDLENNIQGVVDSLSTTDLKVTLHATYRDINIASFLTPIREASVQCVLNSLEKAVKIGAKVVTIHPGKLSGRKAQRADALPVMVSSLKTICSKADDLGLKLGLENMEGSGTKMCQTPREIQGVLAAVDSPTLGVTIDFSHVQLMELSPGKFVRTFSDKIYNTHISDALGSDDHLPFGKGIVNLEEVFEALASIKYTDGCAFEGWYPKDPLKGVITSRRNMESVLRTLNYKSSKKTVKKDHKITDLY